MIILSRLGVRLSDGCAWPHESDQVATRLPEPALRSASGARETTRRPAVLPTGTLGACGYPVEVTMALFFLIPFKPADPGVPLGCPELSVTELACVSIRESRVRRASRQELWRLLTSSAIGEC